MLHHFHKSQIDQKIALDPIQTKERICWPIYQNYILDKSTTSLGGCKLNDMHCKNSRQISQHDNRLHWSTQHDSRLS